MRVFLLEIQINEIIAVNKLCDLLGLLRGKLRKLVLEKLINL